MKIRMKVSIASDYWAYAPEEIVDVPDDLAKKWISVGHAEPVKTEKGK